MKVRNTIYKRDPKKMEIGIRLEKICNEKLGGMSQVKLGKAIGVTGQNIGLIFNGRGSLSLTKAIELCDFANVSMDYLFRGIEEDNYINISNVVDALKEFNEKRKKWKN